MTKYSLLQFAIYRTGIAGAPNFRNISYFQKLSPVLYDRICIGNFLDSLFPGTKLCHCR
jgi:hypothetical protein